MQLITANRAIISSDGTLIWNMTEISPNGKVKEIPVENWGKKYDPLRVWCCVPCLFEFERLAIIQQTWGKYCDKLMFFVGDNTQKEIEVVNVTQKLANGSEYTLYNVVKLKLERTGPDGHGDIYEKQWKMRRFLYVYHKDDYDWMIKADTDAWFSTPNFKGYAQYFDPSRDWYFGDPGIHELKWENVVFNLGGSYALSRSSVNKLNRVYRTEEYLTIAPGRRSPCQDQPGAEDVHLGICLKSIGIFPTNTLDTLYRTRWTPFKKERVESGAIQGEAYWYLKNRFERQGMGKNCCAEHMIVFHWYKNDETLFNDFSKLDAMYSEKSKNNWTSHPLPPKPVTFLFNTSNDEFVDEYFNIENPPKGQKLWKGQDNLWNYSHVLEES